VFIFYFWLGKHRYKRGPRTGHGQGCLSSQSTKGGTKVRRSVFHKRTALQKAQVQNWAKLWDNAEESSAANSCDSQSTPNIGSVKGTDSHNNQSSSTRFVISLLF